MPPLAPLDRSRALLVGIVAALIALMSFPLLAEAAPAPGWRLIGATGPTNLPPLQSEVQRLIVSAEGGTFTLSPTTAEGEGTLEVFAKGVVLVASGSTQATVFVTQVGAFAVGQAVAGADIPAGTTIEAVNGNTLTLSAAATGGGLTTLTAASTEVTDVSSSLGRFHAGDAIAGAGVPAGTTVTAVTDSTLTLSQAPTAAGTVALTATETTAAVAFDAPASRAGGVEAALEALPGVGPGSVGVVGGPGDADGGHPYAVTFEGPFTDRDVPPMAADGSALTGPAPGAVVKTMVPGGAGTGSLAVYATNVGGATSSGPIKLTVGPLPAGITATASGTLGTESAPADGVGWTCLPAGPGQADVECESSAPVGSAMTATPVILPLTVAAGAPAQARVRLAVEGGGALQGDSYTLPITVSSRPAKAGVQSFWAGAFDADGRPSTQAGGHPNLAGTGFLVNSRMAAAGVLVVAGDPRTVDVGLPPGFLGNPLVTGSRCPQDQILPNRGPLCTAEAEVGHSAPVLQLFGVKAEDGGHSGVYNEQPPFGFPAEFGFEVASAPVFALGSVRSDSDYGITVDAPELPLAYQVFGSFLSLYGTPPGAGGKAFLTNPTDCALQGAEAAAGSGPTTTLTANSWQDQDPAAVDSELTVYLPAVTGCDRLGASFHPSFSMQPATHEAASPSAFTAHLSIPQEGLTDPEGLAAPQLKKAVVTLPRGLNVNPASANGLEACSEAQIGLVTTGGAPPNPIRFDKSRPACPDASKLGTVEARSPLLEEALAGTIYLAAQEENPFGSLLALYLVIDSPKNGILVKLPGEVRPDPATGQLTATFDDNPQLPVEDLTLHFRGGGPRSPLATPAVCGTYTTRGELTPWSAPESGPPAATADSFAVTAGPGSGACATSEGALPFSPGFDAGTTSTQAGAYAPLVIKLARRDGEQEPTRLEFTLPPGLTGRLAGVPYCPDAAIAAAADKSGRAEQASPSCPAASELGTVDTAAGVGSEPIHVGGHVYLAGPYEGAPLSAVVITPAVAGPFDLGDVVVRAPLFVNPDTAQITARSDAIPHILKGIPLQLRSVEIRVTRDRFSLNPTSCDPMAVSAGIGGLNGGGASPSSRFQVGNCAALPFKPKLKLRLKGATGRIGHPALKAVLTARPGEANIGRAQVNLPKGEFLDQGNLNKTCTRPVLLAGNCPRSTIYGHARAWTPLLEKPLEGNVYLVGGYGYKLPALVAELNGQIRITLVGKVDSGKNKGIRNTFEVVPDAPVSRFVLEMKGGKRYGLLENSEDLCKAKKARRRAIVRLTGQNGKVDQFRPVVANQCGRKGRKAKR